MPLLRYHENLEALLMLVLATLLQMADGSPFSMKQRWATVWDTDLPSEYFQPLMQKIIKIVLSVIVVIRCTMTYAYVVSAMLVIFSLVKNSAPKLMLPWLLVSMVKSISMTIVESLTGIYVCSAFGKIRKACLEFFISKALEIIFAVYLWGSVLNIYHELERKAEKSGKEDLDVKIRKLVSKRRARSLLDETTLYKTACLNTFEFKDVPQIILQMLGKVEEMSQDSLLGPGMMLASVSNLGSFDNLKTSQSLGELEFVDFKTVQVTGLDEEENLPPPDKALKFLKLSRSDVRKAQECKRKIDKDSHEVDEDQWNQVICNNFILNQPRVERAKVYLQKLPQTESDGLSDDKKKKVRGRSFDIKFGFSMLNLFQIPNNQEQTGYETDEESEEEKGSSLELEDDDKREITSFIMSNIKGEVPVNRIRLDLVSKIFKGKTYAKLYTQDYMNVIGPEVYDRATKLPKVTSFTKLKKQLENNRSANLQAFAKLPITVEETNLEKKEQKGKKTDPACSSKEASCDWKKKISFSSRGITENNKNLAQGKASSVSILLKETELQTGKDEKEEKYENEKINTKSNPPKVSKMIQVEAEELINEKNNTQSNRVSGSGQSNNESIKRKIQIKHAKNLITGSGKIKNDSLITPSPSLDLDVNFTPRYISFSEEEKGRKNNKKESQEVSVNIEDNQIDQEQDPKKLSGSRNKQIYFLMELMQKPLAEVLKTYYELKKEIQKKGEDNFFYKHKHNQSENFKTSYYQKYFQVISRKENKTWKSTVFRKIAPTEDFNTEYNLKIAGVNTQLSKAETALKKLIKNEYTLNNSNNDLFLVKLKQNNRKDSKLSIEIVNTSKQNLKTRSSVVLTSSNPKSRTQSTTVISKVKPNNVMKNQNRNKSSLSLSSNSSKRKSDLIIKTSKISSKHQSDTAIKTSNTNDTSDSSSTESCQKTAPKIKAKAKKSFSLASQNIKQENPIKGEESDDAFSLFYSKAADLSSPLLDMKRFIYPDHIHYSFKHVKKKGFDVNITKGLPLLVRESITAGTKVAKKNMSSSEKKDSGITRRPMDMSFAKSKWQNSQTSVNQSKSLEKKKEVYTKAKPSTSQNGNKVTKVPEFLKKPKKVIQSRCKIKWKDYHVNKKFKKLGRKDTERDRNSTQISSTQVHSNTNRRNQL